MVTQRNKHTLPAIARARLFIHSPSAMPRLTNAAPCTRIVNTARAAVPRNLHRGRLGTTGIAAAISSSVANRYVLTPEASVLVT